MAINTPELKIDPYTSTVPLVQIPPDQISGMTRPDAPLQGQFGRKGTGALAIGDAIVKGLIQGHELKAQKKAEQAKATIAAADTATEAAYQKYQDALSTAGGNVNDTNAKAAYDAYMGVFNQSKQAKAKFIIPEKPQKGQSSQQKKGVKGEAKAGFNNIKDFFEANPHLVPQIALMTMQPKPQGLSGEARVQNAQVQAAEAQAKAATQEASNLTYERGQREQEDQRAARQRGVEAAGGIDAVLADKSASPELKQRAREMKFESLDKQSPEGKMKTQFMQDVLNGNSKNWTPEQRTLAGALGVAPQPQVQTITGKNGHQQQILVDPLTNQQVAGSKPLDLGPPQWSQEFYAKRAADKADLQKAVAADPSFYGVQLKGDPKADKAAIDARADMIYINHDFGIANLAGSTGKTGYEILRDKTILDDTVKAAGLTAKKEGESPLDSGQVMMSYPVDQKGADGKVIPAGTQFAVGRDYFGKMLDEFATPVTENNGVRAFRDIPRNTDNKPPEVLDAERKFIYQWVKNQMMIQKGKNALTSEQADAVLKKTALGTPVTKESQVQPGRTMTAPPPAGTAKAGEGNGMDYRTGLPKRFSAPPPAQAATKMYMVPGYDSPVSLTDAEADKARAANINVEELSPEMMNQFNQ